MAIARARSVWGSEGRAALGRLAATVLAVAAVLLAGPLAGRAGAQNDGGSGDEDPGGRAAIELAERHAPLIVLKAQDEPCDTDGEQYAPAAADIVLDNPQILLRQVGTGNPVVVRGPGAADLYELGEGFYLDFPGDALSPGCIYEQDFRRYAGDGPAVVYAHVATQADAPDKLALQYWFFYYYNEYNNLHEGDWEGIQLLFDVGTVDEALATVPVSVGYSQHFGGEWASWDGSKLERQEGHPVVYAAVGSHASYFEPTLYLGRSGSQGFGCDITEGPSITLEPDVVVLPTTVTDPADRFAWVAFEGKWGERQSGPFDGPTGPATKPRWTAPVDWHEELRSSSVAVPGGADTSTPVVNTFCSVVGWGSRQYITLQQNPLRMIGMAALAAAVALVALRRTSWSFVRALPITRRRRIGEIIFSVARLYRHRPRQVLEIALGFAPVALFVGAVTVIVQQLLLLGVPDTADAELGIVGVVVVAVVSGVLQSIAALIVTSAVASFLSTLESSGTAIDGDGATDVRGWVGYRAVRANAGALSAGFGRALLIVGGLGITIVGLPWAVRQLIRYRFLAETTMLEGLRSRAALARSTELVAGRWFHTAFSVLLLSSAISLVSGTVGLLLLLASVAIPLWLFSVIVTLVSGLAVPFTAIGNVLLYGDAKAERSGAAQAEEVDSF